MSKKPHGTEEYLIFKSFIDPSYAQAIADYALANPEKDEREYYATLGLFGPEVYSTREAKFEFDPDEKIYEMVDHSLRFFNDRYELKGPLTLNRCHVNIMYKDAELAVHADQDVEVPTGVKSYIAGLFLNDDYEGGELYFPDLEHSDLKPEKGDLVLFPGHCTSHGVHKILSGTRVNILAVIHETI